MIILGGHLIEGHDLYAARLSQPLERAFLGYRINLISFWETDLEIEDIKRIDVGSNARPTSLM